MTILKKVTEKLTKEKQDKMKNYTDSIRNRISSSYAMMLKYDLGLLDTEIEKAQKDAAYPTGPIMDRHKNISSVYDDMPYDFKNSFKQFKDVLSNRKDAILIIDIQRAEDDANETYRQMNFEVAIDKYEAAKDSLKKLGDRNTVAKYNVKLAKKIDTTKLSGKNYLTNRAKLTLDEVEELNLQDKTDEAKEKMKYLSELIVGSRFKNDAIFTKYNSVATLLKMSKISSSTKLSDLQGGTKKKGIVKATGGLVLRMNPSTSAAKLMVIPDGSTISIIEETKNTDTIGGRQGVWLKVIFNNQTGFVFGGFVESK